MTKWDQTKLKSDEIMRNNLDFLQKHLETVKRKLGEWNELTQRSEALL